MSGPTTTAIQYRFDQDTDKRTNICYSQYTGNGQRVIYVPVTTAPTGGGRSTVTVTGFAAFFMKNIPSNGNQNTLLGEFLHATVPGTGGTGAAGGPAIFAIRLVE